MGITSTENKKYEFNIFNPRQTQKLITGFSSKTARSEGLEEYIPLESTNNFLEKEYLTGPEYFYNIALQRGDESFSELKEFTNTYKEFAQAYANDIYNLTKIDLIEESIKNILLEIGNDISAAASDSNSSFLLALIVDQSSSYEGLAKKI